MKLLRLCARLAVLPPGDCLIPERCLHDKSCSRCRQLVHYDPAASIEILGREVLVCESCLEGFTDADFAEFRL